MKQKTFAVDIDGTITENGHGVIDLDALLALRNLVKMGHKVIFVSGRSSVEGFILSVFGGTTRIAVGENGGCITCGPNDHILLGEKKECKQAFDLIKSKIPDVKEKPVFPRMTEVVLERTFDINIAKKLIETEGLEVNLSDSKYAYHINSKGIDKGTGFKEVMQRYSIPKEDVIAIGDSETDLPLFEMASISVALGNASKYVRSKASITVGGYSGDGLLESLDILVPQVSEE